MKLFCKHYYVKVGHLHISELYGVLNNPSNIDYIMCKKCGKYREISSYKWNIMELRQAFLNGEKK